MSFFAPDCFHMSVKGHRSLAAALWNDMVSAGGSYVLVGLESGFTAG